MGEEEEESGQEHTRGARGLPVTLPSPQGVDGIRGLKGHKGEKVGAPPRPLDMGGTT